MFSLIWGRNYVDTFGKDPTKDAVHYMRKERLKQIGIYHDKIVQDISHKSAMKKGASSHFGIERNEAGKNYIDDITWNDLEMDDVFFRINNTKSFIGEQVLYHRLDSIDENLNEGVNGEGDGFDCFEKKADFLTLNQVQRCEIEKRLRNIGKKQTAYYMMQLMSYFEPYSKYQILLFRILQLTLVASLVGFLITMAEMLMLLFITTACANLVIYMFQKSKAEAMVGCLEEICILLETCDSFKNKGIIPGEWLGQDVLEAMKALRSLRFYAGRFVSKKLSAGRGTEELLGDYLLGVTLWDLTSYNKIVKMIKENHEEIMLLFEFVGEIDMAISVASFRQSLDVWCLPNFIEGTDEAPYADKKEHAIEIQELIHPLISGAVPNSVLLDRNSFLMGANASGKSTFIKAVAINIILAQTIHTCSAESFEMPRMRVMTSMAVRDDVLSGESYYVREVKYLKRMLDVSGDDRPIFCAVDEILKGTNKNERLAASEAVLRYLSDKNSIIMVATHDYELIDRLQGDFDCYHFRCLLSDNGVEFEYRIHEGTGGETNAVALLNYYHFPKSVVNFANKRLKENGYDNK